VREAADIANALEFIETSEIQPDFEDSAHSLLKSLNSEGPLRDQVIAEIG